MQLSEAREQYVRWLLVTRDLSPHTVRAYDSDIAAFVRHLGTGAPVQEVDRECLVAFIEKQRAVGLGWASIRRRASALRGFCKWLQSRRLLESDAWVGAGVAPERTRRLPRVVPANELDRLLVFLQQGAGVGRASEPGQMRERPDQCTTLLAVALMVATGVRAHEVVGIQCSDVDVAGRSLRLLGKGRRERQVFLTNDWITRLTSAYLEMRVEFGLTHGHLLFNHCRDPLTTPALRSRLAKAARDAGLGIKVTPHMLRHTAATELIEAGVDIRFIQRLLGHASLSTTEIYTHVTNAALKRVVSDADVLGRMLRRDN
jgi:site-specific recombinase XerD